MVLNTAPIAVVTFSDLLKYVWSGKTYMSDLENKS